MERLDEPLITMDRISELAKESIEWSPHPPFQVAKLWKVMDAMSQLVKEAEAEMKRRVS